MQSIQRLIPSYAAVIFVSLAFLTRIGAPAGAEIIKGEVIIEADAIVPSTLVTATEHRVTFVNRSGRSVHIEFHMPGGNGNQHQLFQVPSAIWAIFHRTGTHPFVVHFSDPSIPPLNGAVEVVESASGGPTHRVCNGITVQGECVER